MEEIFADNNSNTNYYVYKERLNKYKRMRAMQIRRRFVFTVLAVLFVIIAFVIGIKAKADSDTHREKGFVSVQVNSGDTVWSIAEEHYSPEFKSIVAYVNEIEKTNHIVDGAITCGNYIIVPVYRDKTN